MSCLRACALGILFTLTAASVTASAGDRAESLSISHAWAPAPAKVGGNTTLYMTITNAGDIADSLLRVRCPFAMFATKMTVDHGEGAPAAREVKAIPIPASQTLTMTSDSWHIRLLQSTEALQAGQTVSCTLAFEKAGSRPVEIAVVAPDATSGP